MNARRHASRNPCLEGADCWAYIRSVTLYWQHRERVNTNRAFPGIDRSMSLHSEGFWCAYSTFKYERANHWRIGPDPQDILEDNSTGHDRRGGNRYDRRSVAGPN